MKTFVAASVVLCLAAVIAFGPEGRVAGQDATGVLREVDQALGASSLKSIRYSGTGFAYAFLQNPRPDVRYPKFYAKYTRAIDFEKGVSREETTRAQFENPPSGGGQQPLYTDTTGAAVTGENSAWGGGAVALTPQGFVRAALASRPTVSPARVGGKPMTMISFIASGKYTVNGYVNAQHLIEKIETWTPQPTLGDMSIETTFSDYRDFSGVKFPARIVQQQWIYPMLELNVATVEPNAAVNLQAPAGGPQEARVESTKVADGVWYLAGTPDPNSQLVEFNDFLVLVESSVTEGRALANIAEAHRLVPGKPIRYHVNSHHHSDHSAGLRAFVAEGSTIVTHEMNRKFYDEVVLKAPHTLEPDTLTKTPKKAAFVYVKDKGKYVITDGTRSLEVYHVNNGHANNLLMSYLPKEKLLMITDIFNDFGMPRPNDPPPGLVSPYYAALDTRLKELKLDVERLAPSHGRAVVPFSQFANLVQGKVQAPAPRPITETR
ncbi:MAG TPA: MBL fold metallo-hydrolase [Vicinamibacterales bacterium]|jgi:glyoxylase-like metal-dependent hydrolase (beta-lactamase superfamily II)|nr:MBL fold metallo-hydrolase [Vicinamibacterales bacterium]